MAAFLKPLKGYSFNQPRPVNAAFPVQLFRSVPVMLETFATQITELNCEHENKSMTSQTSMVKLLFWKENENDDNLFKTSLYKHQRSQN